MRPQAIHILVFPRFQLLDAAGPAQVFATANDELVRAGQAAAYAIAVNSVDGGTVTSTAGVSLDSQPLPDPARLNGATLMVAGGHGVVEAMRHTSILHWLRAAEPVTRRCCSVCTGAFVLAATGLLDGRQVTTHWDGAAILAQHFPTLKVRDDAIHISDGKFHTSAGVTAGIDLCLALLEADLGRDLALSVAKRLVVHMKRPGGQRQFSSELLAQAAPEPIRQHLTDWLRPRLHQHVDVETMATAIGLSARTLHRHLRRQDTSPARLLLELRLELACRLLEQGGGSLKAIARKSGFGSLYNLHRAFVRRLGVTPSDYRSSFG